MKQFLFALSVLSLPFAASAQRHNLYADAGVCFSKYYPGGSLTYNYRAARWLGLGVGVQGYYFYPTIVNKHQFVPGAYLDLRAILYPKSKSQLFVFGDVGMSFYSVTGRSLKEDNILYSPSRNAGTYTNLGLGYFRALTRQGWGVYCSLKLLSNIYSVKTFNLTDYGDGEVTYIQSTGVLSLGLRL